MTEARDKYGMKPEEKMLVQLREELYQGNWKNFLKDLKDRLKDRPYIFKLANRIEEDIERIEKLQAYELKTGNNLADFLEDDEKVKPISSANNF